MYEIIFSDIAWKQFNKLPKAVQERIGNVLERIRVRPWAFLTKLVGDPGHKLRVGDYRLIVDLDKKKLFIEVIKLGHRKNIYL